MCSGLNPRPPSQMHVSRSEALLITVCLQCAPRKRFKSHERPHGMLCGVFSRGAPSPLEAPLVSTGVSEPNRGQRQGHAVAPAAAQQIGGR